MSPRFNLILVGLVLVVAIVRMTVFTVDEREHAIKFRFGEIVKSDYGPGLHFKIPFVNNIAKYPDRILTYEESEERFLTGEKKNLIVDYFITWRIVDPAQYYRSARGDELFAEQRLSAIIREGIKAEFSQRTVQEVVAAERSELMSQMLVTASAQAPALGLDVVDVRVMRIELSDEVSGSVFSRMQQERGRVAAQLRAEGEEEAERIRADADRQRTVILAEAYRDAERLRGEGDARAAALYADAYNQNPSFYSFYRSMSAYRESIGGQQDVLVLSPDSEFFQYIGEQMGAATP
ncbi:MAG: HflC protein [Rhodospirillaceae bacterium]|nr:HflC protein [Rhodospirillaceae bacterium]|tara:strand:- start:3423 stop:4301 length:879 start_codon:yes stop_codon:yes gene_type:complete